MNIKSVACLYTSNEQFKSEVKKTILLIVAQPIKF